MYTDREQQSNFSPSMLPSHSVQNVTPLSSTYILFGVTPLVSGQNVPRFSSSFQVIDSLGRRSSNFENSDPLCTMTADGIRIRTRTSLLKLARRVPTRHGAARRRAALPSSVHVRTAHGWTAAQNSWYSFEGYERRNKDDGIHRAYRCGA